MEKGEYNKVTKYILKLFKERGDMKKLIMLAMVCILGFSISACGKKDKEDNHFVFATWAAGTELNELNQIVDKVNEQANGEYVIEVQSIPSDYYVKISTQIAGKRSPDFFWMTQELISKYAELGAIADLTNQLEASTRLNADHYYEGVLASATYEGKYWGLPWIANPLMVYYNKTMFDNLGIEAPSVTDDWTWSEFIDVARELNGKQNYKGESIYGTVVDGWPNIETFIWAGGGDIIDKDGKTILLDTQESLKGVSYLQTMIQEKLTPKYSEVASLGSNNVWFEKQRVGMFIGGLQDNFEYKVSQMDEKDQFEIGYAPMPVADDGTAWSFDWTASTVMKKDLEGNSLAYKALEDLTLAFFEWKVAAPVKGNVENVAVVAPLKEPALETIAYTLNNARSANYIPEWSDINDKLWYNLYVKLLNDATFDYESEMKTIADYAREKISTRK